MSVGEERQSEPPSHTVSETKILQYKAKEALRLILSTSAMPYSLNTTEYAVRDQPHLVGDKCFQSTR